MNIYRERIVCGIPGNGGVTERDSMENSERWWGIKKMLEMAIRSGKDTEAAEENYINLEKDFAETEKSIIETENKIRDTREMIAAQIGGEQPTPKEKSFIAGSDGNKERASADRESHCDKSVIHAKSALEHAKKSLEHAKDIEKRLDTDAKSLASGLIENSERRVMLAEKALDEVIKSRDACFHAENAIRKASGIKK